MIKNIKTIKDITSFTELLVKEGVNFHPDEDFKNYVNLTTGERTYSDDEAELRNKLMDASFIICKEEGVDIYDIMCEVFLKETGLDKFIPLSSADHLE